MTTMAEQFGLVRSSTCWCCGGLGLCADDWDVIEPCAFCRKPTELAPFRDQLTEVDLDEAAAALRRAIDGFEDGG